MPECRLVWSDNAGQASAGVADSGGSASGTIVLEQGGSTRALDDIPLELLRDAVRVALRDERRAMPTPEAAVLRQLAELLDCNAAAGSLLLTGLLAEARAERARPARQPRRYVASVPARAWVGARKVSEDMCFVCGDGGDLLCCSYCPKVYHLACVDLDRLPTGQWACLWHRCWTCGRGKGTAAGEMLFR